MFSEMILAALLTGSQSVVPPAPSLPVPVVTGIRLVGQRGTQCGLNYEQATQAAYDAYHQCRTEANRSMYVGFAQLACELKKAALLEAAKDAYDACVGQ
jgi:hypothetical protein